MHASEVTQDQCFTDGYALGGSPSCQLCLGFQQRLKKPSPEQEFQRIKEHYPILASTGCSASFCQSGRAIHTEEPRVGKDRPLHQIEAEAVDFLRQMRRDKMFATDADYQDRLREALKEIRENAIEPQLLTTIAISEPTSPMLSDSLSSNGWRQTAKELQYGIRTAWKHSRKCIMRSRYKNLSLRDLRHVQTSVEMGETLVQSLKEAFNHGKIQPTVFVFPQRQVGRSGPMIWNQQLLAFAGYTLDDGSVLGDPMNVSLTTRIIELGWKPPKFRTKWDFLPLVTMAEGEEPAITDISSEDFPLVHIHHPRHPLPFEKLGLRWVPAPVLSRLGFDIGGVQYTASPFIGWFMDAEIGVRDLADKLRYDALPNIVKTLFPDELERPLEQLPEHKRLALLARAQTELNFAVYHSFSLNGIHISDTLTASSSYCHFDDEHLEQYGFRLPADPYWLAPPQGSIIPLWHRGGAPHYQPKPMICRHREDPIKAWKRRQKSDVCILPNERNKSGYRSLVSGGTQRSEVEHRVLVHYCTTGGLAAKLASAAYRALQESCRLGQKHQTILQPQSLDSLQLSDLSPRDVIIVIVSSTGQGDVPPDGRRTVERLHGCRFRDSRLPEASFSIFGNGDSSYADTFNGAAQTIHNLFIECGLRPLNDYVKGDNASESPPWELLNAWLKNLSQAFTRTSRTNTLLGCHIDRPPRGVEWKSLLNSYARYEVRKSPGNRRNLKKVTLYSDKSSYSAMDYLLVLAPNESRKVKQVIRMLRKRGNDKAEFLESTSYFDLLSEFVELEEPFRKLGWAERLRDDGFDPEQMASLPVVEALRLLPPGWQSKIDLNDVLVSMSPITPRTFSIASIPDTVKARNGRQGVELLVQSKSGGKFSEQYLNHAKSGGCIRCKIRPAIKFRKLCDTAVEPIIAFVTGSGFAPMQSLLRFRAQQVLQANESGETTPFEGQISLFLGFRNGDASLIHEGLDEATNLGLLDMLFLTPSNMNKERAQDKVFRAGIREIIETKIRNGAWVFVCANALAADDVETNLNAILGCDVRTALGERYVEDRFDAA